MGIAFTSITLNTPNLQNMLRFYEILGCKFNQVKVTIGSEIYRSTIEGFELSLMCIQHHSSVSHPKVMMGFKIRDMEAKIAKLTTIPGVIMILDPTDMPDGRKAIFQDPDGHSVELLSE